MNIAEENQAQLDKRQAIQAIMRDASLTAQEKQRKIQQLMASGGQAGSSAPASAPPVAVTPAPVPAPPQPQIQPPVASPPAVAAASSPRVGAVASTGFDPAARKGGRVSSGMTASGAATITREGSEAELKSGNAAFHDSASVMSVGTSEPDALSVPTLGAVASTGADPAARKGGRATARITSRASTASSVASSSDARSVGATSASVQEDPALRKAPRTSRTSTVSARTDLTLEPMSVAEEPTTDATMSSSYATNNLGQRNNFGDVEAVPDVKPESIVPLASVPEVPPPTSSYAAPAMATTPVIPAPQEPREQYTFSDNQQSAPQQHETIANAGTAGTISPTIDSGDTVGIQAYVAGESNEVVVGATNVVTEDEIAEEETKRQTRLLRLGGLICCLLLIVIIVPIAIVVPEDNVVIDISESPSYAPSAAPTGVMFADLLDALQPFYPNEESYQAAFATTNTPQYMAAQWATDNAPAGVTGSDPRMISRYALATFYFATNGDEWVRCGVGSTECDAGQEWLTAENECDWLAVTCVDPTAGDYTVKELFFPPVSPDGNNIAGTLPFEVALLSSLTRIVLSKQALQGSIPDTWSRLTNLETLIIGTNQLTGTFPTFFFFENSLLGTIFLSTNKLSGSLPAFSSSALRALRVDDNSFVGTIPSEFGSLGGLQELTVNKNNLTGTVPEELYNLSGLRSLDLGNNTGLTGTLSESIGNLQNLTVLRIDNTTIGGTLPFALFDLINLQILDLATNTFSGSLPTDFSRLSNVTQIELNNNTFTGAVPDGFDSLTLLQTLTLNANSLTGTISATLCARTGTSFLDLKYLTADCLGNPPEVSCDCCTCF